MANNYSSLTEVSIIFCFQTLSDLLLRMARTKITPLTPECGESEESFKASRKNWGPVLCKPSLGDKTGFTFTDPNFSELESTKRLHFLTNQIIFYYYYYYISGPVFRITRFREIVSRTAISTTTPCVSTTNGTRLTLAWSRHFSRIALNWFCSFTFWQSEITRPWMSHQSVKILDCFDTIAKRKLRN